jgi:two-component system response regulator FlrC
MWLASLGFCRSPLILFDVASGVRVLVVEDDRAVRESTAQLLEEAGYEVLGAGSGSEALATLQSGYRPAVILADYRMAGMNGAELLTAVKANPELTAINAILTSGFAEEGVAAIAGAAGFLKKPFDPDHMLTLVARLARPSGS